MVILSKSSDLYKLLKTTLSHFLCKLYVCVIYVVKVLKVWNLDDGTDYQTNVNYCLVVSNWTGKSYLMCSLQNWNMWWYITYGLWWVKFCDGMSHVVMIYWVKVCDGMSHTVMIYWVKVCDGRSHVMIYWVKVCDGMSHTVMIYWVKVCDGMSHKVVIYWVEDCDGIWLSHMIMIYWGFVMVYAWHMVKIYKEIKRIIHHM